MSPAEPVLYETHAAVARVTIDRPHRRNAIDAAVVRGIASAIGAAEADPDVRALVLTGAGDKAFCAGGDLTAATADSPVDVHYLRAELGDLFRRMRTSSRPIVARVNGHALGGGFGLMLACDVVVACDDVQLGTPEVNIGLWPFIITAVIQRDLPRKLALELMLTGRRITAAEAVAAGFVNRSVPRASLDDEVDAICGEIAAKSPVVTALGKRSFYRAEDLDFDAAIDHLAGMLSLCLTTEDAAEGVSAFLAKRPPAWRGR